jgi:hypothetical protein
MDSSCPETTFVRTGLPYPGGPCNARRCRWKPACRVPRPPLHGRQDRTIDDVTGIGIGPAHGAGPQGGLGTVIAVVNRKDTVGKKPDTITRCCHSITHCEIARGEFTPGSADEPVIWPWRRQGRATTPSNACAGRTQGGCRVRYSRRASARLAGRYRRPSLPVRSSRGTSGPATCSSKLIHTRGAPSRWFSASSRTFSADCTHPIGTRA